MAYEEKATQNSARGFGATAQTSVKGTKSTAQLLSGIGSAMAHNGSGEALKRTMDAMSEVLKKENGQVGQVFKLFPVDAQANGLNVSSILLYAHDVESNTLAVFTYLIAASVGVLRPKVAKFPEGQYDIPVVISDLYGLTLRQANFAALVAGLKLDADINIQDAGGNAIPREMAYDDETSIRTIIYHAVYAIQSIFVDDMETPVVFDITEKASNVYFHGDLDFRPGALHNGVGLPIRRDVTVAITSVDGNGTQEAGDQTYATSQLISNASAYIDLVFAGKKAPVQQYYGQPMIEPTQLFTAKLAIVDTTTMAGVTPELQIMALASLTKLSAGQYSQAWTNVYNPSVAGSNTLHDISALAIEMEIGRIDTTAPDWNPIEFCRHAVDERLVYVLHVEDVGDLSWMHKMFKSAATNADARGYLWDAANNLTGGKVLSNFVTEDHAISYIEDDRIFLGYYVDESNKRRDLREIDYLYALKKYGETDMSMVMEFGSTFNPETAPLDLRLGKRKLLIEAMLCQAITITGYATPVIIDPEWLTGVQNAIAAVGGEPKFEHQLAGQHTQQREYNAIRQYGMAGIAPAPVYTAQSQYQAYYDPRFHR